MIPRNQSYVTYPQEELIMTTILSFCCHNESRRHMNEVLNNDNVIDNFKKIFNNDINEIPHGDTINNYYKIVNYKQFRDVLYKIFHVLLEKKVLADYRIDNKYYQVIIDGVNMYTFDKEHIEGNIVKKYTEEKITYHTIKVFIKKYGGHWVTDDNDRKGEMKIMVVLDNDISLMPVMSVMKCYQDCDENSLYVLAMAIEKILEED